MRIQSHTINRMRILEIELLAEAGFRLYAITGDELTLSAAKNLTVLVAGKKTKGNPAVKLQEPHATAVQLLQRQMAAYETLYSRPLM